MAKTFKQIREQIELLRRDTMFLSKRLIRAKGKFAPNLTEMERTYKAIQKARKIINNATAGL